jgi:hypothetical protein
MQCSHFIAAGYLCSACLYSVVILLCLSEASLAGVDPKMYETVRSAYELVSNNSIYVNENHN